MVQLRIGDTLRFRCQFYHQGAAYSGAKLRCGIGQLIFGIWPYDEIIWAISPSLSFPADAVAKQYEVFVNLLITSAISPSNHYESEVKLFDIPGGDIIWRSPENDIEILSAAEAFSNLSVSYAKG